MDIAINFFGIYISAFIPLDSPLAFGWWLTKTVGWIFPVFLFIYGMLIVWQNWLRNKDRARKKYILLAIDVPKNNEQTPRAVENIFSHLAGAHQPLNFYHKWWFGEVPDSFSFEIVSLGGYIQFIIHTRDVYRDLVEAIIYAQYPDAEITEVEDYTKEWKVKFPSNKYDLVGTELILKAPDAYPLITYSEFEDSISQEIKDPMASILESLARMGPGEEVGIQFVITPADNDWGNCATPIINKLIGASGSGKKDFFQKIQDFFGFVLDNINPAPEGTSSNSKDEPNKLLYLTAGEKDTVSAIEHKIGKLGYHVRLRYIYLADKKVFNKTNGLQGIYGSFKQFNDLGLNSLKPYGKFATFGIVWFKKKRLVWRKNRILFRYKDRGHTLSPGEYGFILNTEELASLWHFPMMQVKAPLVKMTQSKKSEPPMSLPIQNVRAIQPVKNPSISATPPRDLPTR